MCEFPFSTTDYYWTAYDEKKQQIIASILVHRVSIPIECVQFKLNTHTHIYEFIDVHGESITANLRLLLISINKHTSITNAFFLFERSHRWFRAFLTHCFDLEVFFFRLKLWIVAQCFQMFCVIIISLFLLAFELLSIRTTPTLTVYSNLTVHINNISAWLSIFAQYHSPFGQFTHKHKIHTESPPTRQQQKQSYRERGHIVDWGIKSRKMMLKNAFNSTHNKMILLQSA